MIFGRSVLAAVSAALLLIASAADAFAGDGLIYQLSVGALSHDVPDLWSGFRAEKESLDVNIEAQLSPSMQLFFGTLRPAIGGSINTAGQTSMGYVDARWTYEAASGVFIGLGIGAAIHDGNLDLSDLNRKALGSRVLFHFPLEIGYRFDAHQSVSAYFEHMSNGYTQHYNEGMDRLGVRYGYRF
jgi:lipid A 3-O-deacylase